MALAFRAFGSKRFFLPPGCDRKRLENGQLAPLKPFTAFNEERVDSRLKNGSLLFAPVQMSTRRLHNSASEIISYGKTTGSMNTREEWIAAVRAGANVHTAPAQLCERIFLGAAKLLEYEKTNRRID